MTATAPSMYVSSHLARFSYNCNKFCNLHSSPSKIGQTEELPFILSVTISGLHLDSKHLQRRVVIDLFLQRPAAHSTCMFRNPGSIYYVWRWGAAFALTWLVTLLWWSKKIWYVLDILRYFRHLTLHRKTLAELVETNQGQMWELVPKMWQHSPSRMPYIVHFI